MKNFPLHVLGQRIVATTESAAHELTAERARDLMAYNPGPNPVYLICGGPTVQANDLCMIILPGEKGAYDKGNFRHVGVLAVNADQEITVWTGEGA